LNVHKRKSAPERKKEIVETAIRLAGEVGPDRLTTQHLADAIGISQPAIFRHFATKDAIWQAVGEQIARTMRASTKQLFDENSTPCEQLRKMVLAQLSFIQSNPAVPAILFSRELHAENDNLRIFFSNLMSGRHNTFANLIAAETAAGGFHADLNADDAAYLVLGFLQGQAMRWSLNARSFDLVKEGARLFELLLRSFR